MDEDMVQQIEFSVDSPADLPQPPAGASQKPQGHCFEDQWCSAACKDQEIRGNLASLLMMLDLGL